MLCTENVPHLDAILWWVQTIKRGLNYGAYSVNNQSTVVLEQFLYTTHSAEWTGKCQDI